jgi:hypothetical protein
MRRTYDTSDAMTGEEIEKRMDDFNTHGTNHQINGKSLALR